MKLAVIGGGPAGMAAAVSARKNGVEDVVLIERHDYLGGVLPQCIHTGFGTQLFTKGTIQGANTPGCGLKKHCLRVLM